MPKFAANLSMMFNEVPFLERFAAARNAGFDAVEYLFPYDFPAEDVARNLEDQGLVQALFNMPPGDWEAGDRGISAIPGREVEFQQSLETALEYAAALNCKTIHCMAGILGPGVMPRRAERTYIGNLQLAAEAAEKHGITVLIEPLNSRDAPGYLLSYNDHAHRIIEEVGMANLKLQLDLYHTQIMHGDLAISIREFMPITGHIQIAGVPQRHEPDFGEINYPYLFELIDELGYEGWIGCEYRPRRSTLEGLGWIKPYLGQS
ncbi:MAG: 2-oxo-tetronate isomerase [Pseudomonadota bacterium]